MKPVSGKKLCKALEKKGWTLDRVKGSHHIYVMQGQPSIPVPVHSNKTLKKGTQAGIMKSASLTDDDLQANDGPLRRSVNGVLARCHYEPLTNKFCRLDSRGAEEEA